MARVRVVLLGLVLWWSGIQLATSAQGQTLEPIGMIPGPAATVHVHESRAYVSDGPTLRIVDVADPPSRPCWGPLRFP